MASIIVAAGLFTYNEIHKRKQSKRDKKRLATEARYLELEQEHFTYQEKLKAQPSEIVDSQSPFQRKSSTVKPRERRASTDSGSLYSYDCDPSRWVDEVVNDRPKA
jgi:hypothetical protein